MSKRPKGRRGGLPALLALALLAVLFFRWSNTSLQITAFSPSFQDLPQGFDGCRCVVLGDLHSARFGEENQALLEAVRAQEPEYIFLVGDLLDAFREIPKGYAGEMAAGLAAIAPTYYVTGNHEWAIGGVPELKKALEAQGVTVLSNQYVTLERGGDTLVLAGIDDPNGYADQKSPEALAAEVYAQEGDPFWILLAHRNDHFPEQYSLLGADLVVSGHGHGGLVRLPFTDGLVSTDRTFFPSYTAGLYEKTARRCSSPGAWETPAIRSGCSTGRRWQRSLFGGDKGLLPQGVGDLRTHTEAVIKGVKAPDDRRIPPEVVRPVLLVWNADLLKIEVLDNLGNFCPHGGLPFYTTTRIFFNYHYNIVLHVCQGGTMNFAEKIRRLRRAKHLTQAQVAEEIGISMRGYQDLELGIFPRYEKLLRIADYYDVSVDWLMGRTENRYAHKS